jgi:hypothetical protein
MLLGFILLYLLVTIAIGALAAIVVGTLVWLYFEWVPSEIPSLLLGGLASLIAMLLGSWLRPDDSFATFVEWRDSAVAARTAGRPE